MFFMLRVLRWLFFFFAAARPNGAERLTIPPAARCCCDLLSPFGCHSPARQVRNTSTGMRYT
jgi:hypothetical protein